MCALHLSSLQLEEAQGEVLGYLGPNGAGKTTTSRLLLGFLRPTAGRAEIFGRDVQRDSIAAHRRLAYVAGETNLWPSLTGAETLHLLGRVQGRVDPGYREELIERFAFDPSKKVRSYSKGNRQKLGLIAGLMGRADLLLLDEPTSGLDPLIDLSYTPPFGNPWDAVQLAAQAWLSESRQESARVATRGTSASATSRSGSGRSR